ncbi:dTDP-4-dehydrorhamnose reductase [Ensifer sp. HO-A22]|uniref:dTDP-4-dehydrorhamnose reductase n=1 Tax=Ensifer oleiphilus TaxID=2742698 RepID=A0A7Y6Q6D2_9HYPH|nr:dTDP-4-dehydrorhamnose reductase [Ensifer oleiphilus]NVD39791.1 dTDP-4-dehydrorhamnose reductase [Ensifer oleiphilus]
MKILVTGGGGQVGTEFQRLPWSQSVDVCAPHRSELNLTDPERLQDFVLQGRFDAVINLAAYTAVDNAEHDIVNAWRVNALAVAALAEATKRAEVPLVHVSTDYVFNGSNCTPYKEDDSLKPLGVYGASKAGGEQALRTANARHVILRTAWLFSPFGGNFVKTMLRLAAERPVLRVVDDQIGCPTSAKDVAAALAIITRRLIEDKGAPTGTYHFVNSGEASWCAFAREIFRQSADAGSRVPTVEAISTQDYPTPAVRPAYSCLSTEKITRDFGIVPRAWQEALTETIAQLHANARTRIEGKRKT